MSSTLPILSSDLNGRQARCACGRTELSSTALPHFQYQGPGSRSAAEVCVCGYHFLAHHADIRSGAISPTLRECSGFRPRGDLGYDSYWCGCDGYSKEAIHQSKFREDRWHL